MATGTRSVPALRPALSRTRPARPPAPAAMAALIPATRANKISRPCTLRSTACLEANSRDKKLCQAIGPGWPMVWVKGIISLPLMSAPFSCTPDHGTLEPTSSAGRRPGLLSNTLGRKLFKKPRRLIFSVAATLACTRSASCRPPSCMPRLTASWISCFTPDFQACSARGSSSPEAARLMGIIIGSRGRSYWPTITIKARDRRCRCE